MTKEIQETTENNKLLADYLAIQIKEQLRIKDNYAQDLLYSIK